MAGVTASGTIILLTLYVSPPTLNKVWVEELLIDERSIYTLPTPPPLLVIVVVIDNNCVLSLKTGLGVGVISPLAGTGGRITVMLIEFVLYTKEELV